MNYSANIYRIDFPVRDKENGLTLGPGLVINQIPYYYLTLTDGITTGSAWSVSSPLWGGYPLPLDNAILRVESLLLDMTRYVLKRIEQSTNLLDDARSLHESIYDNLENPWTNERDVPPLIKGMVLAPIMGAVLDYLGKKHSLSVIDILRRLTTIPDIFSDQPQFEALAPFFTIGGTDSDEKIKRGIEQFGERPVYKFKAGSAKKKISDAREVAKKRSEHCFEDDSLAPILEAEWMRHIFDTILDSGARCVVDVNRAYTFHENAALLMSLKIAQHDRDVVFIEQSGSIGEEPHGFECAFAHINNTTAVCADESAYSGASVDQLGKKISTTNRQCDVIIIPKFEKGGPIEIVRMLEAAYRHGMFISPSTLTGPPPHLVYYGHIFSHVNNIYTIPGTEHAISMEANFYEICDQEFAVTHTMQNYAHELFRTDIPYIPIHDCFTGHGWPELAAIKPVEEIAWIKKFQI